MAFAGPMRCYGLTCHAMAASRARTPAADITFDASGRLHNCCRRYALVMIRMREQLVNSPRQCPECMCWLGLSTPTVRAEGIYCAARSLRGPCGHGIERGRLRQQATVRYDGWCHRPEVRLEAATRWCSQDVSVRKLAGWALKCVLRQRWKTRLCAPILALSYPTCH